MPDAMMAAACLPQQLNILFQETSHRRKTKGGRGSLLSFLTVKGTQLEE
jgi:hypothetical protein